ncbi:MAG: carboxypeptidase-like regulatory domain-containing protein [Armatimonadia bacterium]
MAGTAFAELAPRLDAPSCTPSTGTTATTFRFSIVYYGAAEPTIHDVHLDAAVLPMRKVSVANGGALYVYETKLAPGAHRYRFRFQTGTLALRKPGPTAAEWYTGLRVTSATETYSISGLIKANDVALAGAEVRLTKEGVTILTVKTNAEGRFTFTGLKAGSYRVTPVKLGYRMDPLYRIMAFPGSPMACNFRAIKL